MVGTTETSVQLCWFLQKRLTCHARLCMRPSCGQPGAGVVFNTRTRSKNKKNVIEL